MKVFCFHGVKKGFIGNKCVKMKVFRAVTESSAGRFFIYVSILLDAALSPHFSPPLNENCPSQWSFQLAKALGRKI